MTKSLVNWYHEHCRPLPFRERPSPYAIWVSEIMAQQTRMAALVPYFEAFTAKFPTVEALASAPLEEVLDAWTGLGYYARARNLHKAACLVMDKYGGELPDTRKTLESLPGIGSYTAGAILSIAFNQPEPAVDGNVLRVFARITAYTGDVMASIAQANAFDWVRQQMTEAPPRYLTQALMELGALVCTPKQLKCENCPVADYCQALAQGVTDTLPVRTKPPKQRVEPRNVWVYADEHQRVLVRRRSEKLLHGLWEFPSQAYFEGPGESLGKAAFKFTHIQWVMEGFFVTVPKGNRSCPEGCQWVTFEELQTLPMPTAIKFYQKAVLRKLDSE